MNITGKITVIKPLTIVGNNLEKIQIIVVEQGEKRNQLCVDFLGENTKLLDTIKEGDIARVEFSTAVNPTVQGMVFNRISGTAIEKIT